MTYSVTTSLRGINTDQYKEGVNDMDFIMDWEKAKEVVDQDGWDGFMDQFNDKNNYYSVSKYWYEDKKFICKFRGERGDKIIGWKGVHDA